MFSDFIFSDFIFSDFIFSDFIFEIGARTRARARANKFSTTAADSEKPR